MALPDSGSLGLTSGTSSTGSSSAPGDPEQLPMDSLFLPLPTIFSKESLRLVESASLSEHKSPLGKLSLRRLSRYLPANLQKKKQNKVASESLIVCLHVEPLLVNTQYVHIKKILNCTLKDSLLNSVCPFSFSP